MGRMIGAVSAMSVIAGVALAVSASSAEGQPTSIESLSFMEGHWERTTDGMHVEQVFLSASAGTVVGLQRRTQDGATLVSYFFVIEETDQGIVCRFKHFENDYTTYEDRNGVGPRTFALVEVAGQSAMFEEQSSEGALQLRYRVTEEGLLGIAVGSPGDFRSGSYVESLHAAVRQ